MVEPAPNPTIKFGFKYDKADFAANFFLIH